MKSILLIGILFFSFIGIFSNSIHVFGHANPVLYNPPSNSIFQLDQLLPNNITILYSERPEPKVSYIHVLNSNNERIDNNDFKIVGEDERGASATLDSTKLSSGTYTISWLVLSKDDGHITKGSYVFTITDPLSTTNTSTNTTKEETNIFSEQTIIDKVNLEYEITPLIAGLNTFTVTLKDEMGKPINNVKNVMMQFNNQEQNIGPIIANLKKAENGIYNTTGAYISQEGKWNIKITVQRTGEYDLNHSFDIVAPSK
ncbi:MAG TPA: copper resistance protein CopC [Nitrososphaeraceae archaeon]|nr:copper resistance protein CopC [Nitrososphaeraceae archaeon]